MKMRNVAMQTQIWREMNLSSWNMRVLMMRRAMMNDKWAGIMLICDANNSAHDNTFFLSVLICKHNQ